MTRRASGLGLALAINVVLLLVLFGLGARQFVRMAPNGTLIVNLTPESTDRPAARSKVRESEPQPKSVPRPAPPAPPLPKQPIERPLDMIEVSRDQYAAADLNALPDRSADSAEGSRSDDSQPVGRGPNGQLLYAAEWVREPTNAELGGYLPVNAPNGWGVVACRTVAGHRVDDCIELENYPRGSRLAGAVRQAAWQFRVRPPRKNGKEMVGEWVTIRIEYAGRRQN